jgi:hypothetical protein
MVKKLLFGSIITATVLIGASFTPVLGFKDVDPDVKTSPLFTIRVHRAIQKEAKEVRCEFIGQSNIQFTIFPRTDSTKQLFHQVVDDICMMDDGTFTRFVDAVIQMLCEGNPLSSEAFLEIKELFLFIKKNPEEAKKYPFDLKKHSYTMGCPPPTFQETPTWCFKLFVILGILIVTFPVWFPIYLLIKLKNWTHRPSILPNCNLG